MAIHTEPLPGSRKVYMQGSREDIMVPMREISLSDSEVRGESIPNAPLRIYDASGPYTDTDYEADVAIGLPPMRRGWIAERADTEAYQGRIVQPEDNGFSDAGKAAERGAEIFPPSGRLPLRALAGATLPSCIMQGRAS